MAPVCLDPRATSTKNYVENHNDKNEVKDAPAIVANARPHVVPATAKYEQENDQKNNKHVEECSIGLLLHSQVLFETCLDCPANSVPVDKRETGQNTGPISHSVPKRPGVCSGVLFLSTR